MGGLFGVVTKENCIQDLFFGTDYHSHLGTKRGGLAVKGRDGLKSAIRNIENDQFKSKLDDDLPKLHGSRGIGVISDYDDQPLIIASHLGTYAIVTVGKINNLDELAARAATRGVHFSEMSRGGVNPTELVATLINEGATFAEGIQNAQERLMVPVRCSSSPTKDSMLHGTGLEEHPLCSGRNREVMRRRSKRVLFPMWGTSSQATSVQAR